MQVTYLDHNIPITGKNLNSQAKALKDLESRIYINRINVYAYRAETKSISVTTPNAVRYTIWKSLPKR